MGINTGSINTSFGYAAGQQKQKQPTQQDLITHEMEKERVRQLVPKYLGHAFLTMSEKGPDGGKLTYYSNGKTVEWIDKQYFTAIIRDTGKPTQPVIRITTGKPYDNQVAVNAYEYALPVKTPCQKDQTATIYDDVLFFEASTGKQLPTPKQFQLKPSDEKIKQLQAESAKRIQKECKD